MENLEGKTAFITGASQGIGRACALSLAKMGARIALAARNESKLEAVAAEIAAGGGQAKSFVMDVSDEASIQTTAKAAIAHFGSVDILVNNARVYAFSPIETLTSGSINAMFSVNVFGLMRRPRQRYRYSPRRVEASSILAM